MADANLFIPPFPDALPAYDQLNEAQFRRVIRDGMTGMEDVINEKITAATPDIENIGGVDITGPLSNKDVLIHNGTSFVDRQLAFSDLSDYISGVEDDGEIMYYTSGSWFATSPSTIGVPVKYSDYLTTTFSPTSSNWGTAMAIPNIASTGYYKVLAALRMYGTSTVDVKLRFYYLSTASGAFGYQGMRAGTCTDADLASEGTIGATIDFTGSGIATIWVAGYLDITSVSGTPTLQVDIARGTGTTGTTSLYAGSWVEIERLGNT